MAEIKKMKKASVVILIIVIASGGTLAAFLIMTLLSNSKSVNRFPNLVANVEENSTFSPYYSFLSRVASGVNQPYVHMANGGYYYSGGGLTITDTDIATGLKISLAELKCANGTYHYFLAKNLEYAGYWILFNLSGRWYLVVGNFLAAFSESDVQGMILSGRIGVPS